MTEADWLAAADPLAMLAFLRTSGKASDRKLRLFAVACCRRVSHLLYDKYSRKALTIVERYADAEVSEGKLGFAWGDARRAAQIAHRVIGHSPGHFYRGSSLAGGGVPAPCRAWRRRSPRN